MNFSGRVITIVTTDRPLNRCDTTYKFICLRRAAASNETQLPRDAGRCPSTLRPSLENVLLDGRAPEECFNIFQELVVACDGIIGHYLPGARVNTGDQNAPCTRILSGADHNTTSGAIGFTLDPVELSVAYRHHPITYFVQQKTAKYAAILNRFLFHVKCVRRWIPLRVDAHSNGDSRCIE